MYLRIQRLILSLLLFPLLSCGDALSTDTFLVVKMKGSLVAPDSAEGNQDPKWQEYTLQGATMVDSDSNTINLFQDMESTAFKIINRSQIILETKIKEEWVGKEISSLTISFATQVTTHGLYDEETLTLSAGDVVNSEAFTIEQGKGVLVEIDVNWKNTVTRTDDSPPTETTTLPELVISAKAQ